MMKKVLCVLILGALALGAAYALDMPEFKMAAGGGGFFDLGIPLDKDKSGEDMILTFGAFGFFDATFVEADIAVGYGIQDKFSRIGIEVAVLGKYPFNLGPVTVFPLLGVKFNIIPYAAFDGTSVDEPMKMNNLGFQVGGGVDYFFTESIFLRGELLFNLDLFPFDKDASGDNSGIAYLGPRAKIGVGFQF